MAPSLRSGKNVGVYKCSICFDDLQQDDFRCAQKGGCGYCDTCFPRACFVAPLGHRPSCMCGVPFDNDILKRKLTAEQFTSLQGRMNGLRNHHRRVKKGELEKLRIPGCPGCLTAWEPTPGECMVMTCPQCEQIFCAWCMKRAEDMVKRNPHEDLSTTTHHHLAECVLNFSDVESYVDGTRSVFSSHHHFMQIRNEMLNMVFRSQGEPENSSLMWPLDVPMIIPETPTRN